MNTSLTIFEFIKNVLLNTVSQLVSILGIFFFFGLILYFFARFTRTTFVKSIGEKFDIYVTGWIGTPIHELGHAIFCIPFGHRIVEMKLFSPNSANGSLGYVNHSYKPNNVWHKIGNFFIGFGPILFGSFVIFMLIKYLLPNNEVILSIISNQKTDISSVSGFLQQFITIYSSGIQILSELFSMANLKTWQFWVFLYISLCISSHMELSPPDLKGVWSGLVAIIILLIVINSITVFFGVNISRFTNNLSAYTYMTSGIFTFATIISAMFFFLSYISLNIYTLIKYRKIFSPIA